MFTDAIDEVGGYTRPVYTILRKYNSIDILCGAATFFFVNEEGVAITCRHVAELFVHEQTINNNYSEFEKSKKKILPDAHYKKNFLLLQNNYKYNKDATIQMKSMFMDGFSGESGSIECILHPTLDIAIVKFIGYKNKLYSGYAKFIKDTSQIKQGKYLCRLGYPFAEFTHYRYNPEANDIEWTNEGNKITPRFPIDGIVTRHLLGSDGVPIGIEMSTPGLKGQSGGPLFDTNGTVYGMQSQTHSLHLGFDMKNTEIVQGGQKIPVQNYQAFLHVGYCIHADKIKEFLKEHNVKYYEEDAKKSQEVLQSQK